MNVLIVGGGWIAETVYVPFLIQQEKINNIYIVDLDINFIQEKFKKYKKINCISYEKVMNITYETIFISSPNYLHAETIKQFSNLDVKIFVEKPICINQIELNELNKAFKNTPASIYVSAPLRYRKDMQIIKDMISNNKIGNVYHVEITWAKRCGTPGSAWFTQKNLSGGGVLFDMAPHLLDLFYWYFGYRKANKYLSSASSFFLSAGEGYANWHKRKSTDSVTDVEDSCFSLLTYNDLSLSLNTTWVSNIEDDYLQIKVWGTKSILDVVTSIGFSTNALYKETKINITSGSKPKTTILKTEERKEPFNKMLADFISGKTSNITSGLEALNTTKDILSLYNNMSQVGGK